MATWRKYLDALPLLPAGSEDAPFRVRAEFLRREVFRGWNPQCHRRTIILDPRDLFGGLVSQEEVLPDLYAYTILAAIKVVRDERIKLNPQWANARFKVDVSGRVELELPLNWHINLVNMLLGQNFVVAAGNTVTLKDKNLVF